MRSFLFANSSTFSRNKTDIIQLCVVVTFLLFDDTDKTTDNCPYRLASLNLGREQEAPSHLFCVRRDAIWPRPADAAPAGSPRRPPFDRLRRHRGNQTTNFLLTAFLEKPYQIWIMPAESMPHRNFLLLCASPELLSMGPLVVKLFDPRAIAAALPTAAGVFARIRRNSV